jgi:hypothetical protein|tara:strand:+ start:455 stop:1096 length:642 start_codon:yes stop_codon:yes gene_type:complete
MSISRLLSSVARDKALPSDRPQTMMTKPAVDGEVGIPPMMPRAPASSRLADMYARGPGIASLVNPPRTDPGGEEDRQKMMDMQREMYRRFLTLPSEETSPVDLPVDSPVDSPVGSPVGSGYFANIPDGEMFSGDSQVGGFGRESYGLSPEELMNIEAQGGFYSDRPFDYNEFVANTGYVPYDEAPSSREMGQRAFRPSMNLGGLVNMLPLKYK